MIIHTKPIYFMMTSIELISSFWTSTKHLCIIFFYKSLSQRKSWSCGVGSLLYYYFSVIVVRFFATKSYRVKVVIVHSFVKLYKCAKSVCCFFLWQTCSSLLLPWQPDVWHSPCRNKNSLQNALPKIDLFHAISLRRNCNPALKSISVYYGQNAFYKYLTIAFFIFCRLIVVCVSLLIVLSVQRLD